MTNKVQTNLLISVKLRFAQGLLDGTKKVELRRVRPSVGTGDRVFLYATAPEQRILGYIVVERVVAGAPALLWEGYGSNCGVNRKEFNAYFRHCDCGYAIVAAGRHRLGTPLSIQALRRSVPGFCPPQGYFYLKVGRPITNILQALLRAA